MGCENISLEYLSASLKKAGHSVCLAYDPSLFDDKNYFYKPGLARIFDQRKNVVKRILRQKPDILGISVFSSNYQWALDIARQVKAVSNPLVIFGGIHPTAEPDEVLGNECVDAICRDEGDHAIVKLADSLEKGTIDTSIENLWFKDKEAIVKNPMARLQDLNSLPMPDKTLFENDIPMNYMYLTVTSKGCPFACSFCSNSFLKKIQKGRGRFLRERSVDLVMEELLLYKKRYNYQWVDIKNNTFSATRDWTLEFLERYEKEIRCPLRVMGHPKKIDDQIAKAMKSAGVWRVQLGIESLREDIRRDVLHRKESNEDIFAAIDSLNRHKIGFSIDHMVGLPGQKDEDLEQAAVTYSKYRHVVRITPFWLQYLCGTDLMDIGKKLGVIDESALNASRLGLDHHYIYQGSVTDVEKVRTLRGFHILFRLVPTLGPKWAGWITKNKRYRIFRYLPMGPVITLVDFFASFVINDLTSISYIKTYFWTILRIFSKGKFPKTHYNVEIDTV